MNQEGIFSRNGSVKIALLGIILTTLIICACMIPSKCVNAATNSEMTKDEVTVQLKSIKKKIKKDPCKYFDYGYEDTEYYSYTIQDIDKDDYDELVVEMFFSGDLCCGIIYDYYDGQIEKNEYSGVIVSGGTYIRISSPAMGNGNTTNFCTLKKGKLKLKACVGTSVMYPDAIEKYVINDKKVSRAKMLKTFKKYNKKSKLAIKMKPL